MGLRCPCGITSNPETLRRLALLYGNGAFFFSFSIHAADCKLGATELTLRNVYCLSIMHAFFTRTTQEVKFYDNTFTF